MAGLQREIRIRRRIESIYNKEQDDFPDLRSFGDYEEEKEDIIFNLSQGIDADAMEAKIAAYQQHHHDQILINEAKKAEKQRTKHADDAKPIGESIQDDTAKAAEELPETKAAGDLAFKPSETLQPSLPPPPAMLSQEHQGPGETSNPELPAMSKRETIGLVSGWHPDMPRKRALKEAYSTIFVL